MTFRRAAAATLLVLLLGVWAGTPAAWQGAQAWLAQDEQLRLVQRLKAALPAGWNVGVAGIGQIPDGWRSLDTRTVQLQGSNGVETFRLWFVPADWIGIRLPNPKILPMRYWEGVLADRDHHTYKAISPDGPFVEFEALETVP